VTEGAADPKMPSSREAGAGTRSGNRTGNGSGNGSGLAWFLSRRYLASRKKGRFLSFITWIALGGVTVGVTALIVVLAVMNGMQEELRGKILDSTPHVLVLERGTALRLNNWREVMADVREHPQVRAATPFILTKVAISRAQGYAQAADLWGMSLEIDPGDAATEMEARIIEQLDALERTETGLPPLVLGSHLATRMQIFPGDTVQVMPFEAVRPSHFGWSVPTIRLFEVTGTFTTGMYDYDAQNMYARIDDLQQMLGLRERDQVSGLSVQIDDAWRANQIGPDIRDALDGPYEIRTWIDTHQSLFAALQLEKLALGVILFLIVLVAAFNIVSTLVMVVVDRTSEIGILKSMGMTDGQVLRIFVMQGVAIGALGTALGTGLGLLLSWILDRFEIIRIPPDVYFIDRLPVSVNPSDVLIIIGGSLLISLAATIYPALQASRLQPVEAIRHD
jgi:lipoprotein-releasing system permease protein